ncbi:hypothetical protein WJX77_010547 [Trebouxia sp. C0004]
MQFWRRAMYGLDVEELALSPDTACSSHHACWSQHLWFSNVNGSWDTDSDPEDRDMLFIEHFRMTHGVFHDLCDKLRPHIQRRDTRRRPAVPAELRVAAAVYRLAQWANIQGSFAARSDQFLLGKT